MTVQPKIKGSQQIRFSTKILKLNNPDVPILKGKIQFPIIKPEEYEEFLIGDETTKQTLNLLNLFGEKYGVNRFGDNIPQDVIKNLSKNNSFKLDIGRILNRRL